MTLFSVGGARNLGYRPGVYTMDLFDSSASRPRAEHFAPGACLLHAFAAERAAALVGAIERVTAAAPFRHLITPGGFRMSVAMTNCGSAGWVSDRRGYRYEALDPLSGQQWPAMPAVFSELADHAARAAGFEGFAPDACLVNRYGPGDRLTLHQDKDELDLDAPIVSVSLGLPAVFLFGGLARTDQHVRVPLRHGDVVVWGGPSRLFYHGIMPIKEGLHPLVGSQRLNLTFRRTH